MSTMKAVDRALWARLAHGATTGASAERGVHGPSHEIES